MSQVYLVTESQLRQCLSLDKNIINEIDDAFRALEEQEIIMPPVLSMSMPRLNAEVDIKTAYVPNLKNFSIKISPGFFNNPSLSLPSLGGLMVTFDTQTGILSSVLLDNGFLTDIRTAAAGAVAARHLAPKNAKKAGIIGGGLQATLQAKALLLERKIDHLYVWCRDSKKAYDYATKQSKELNISVSVSDSIEQLVKNSQVVITTTPAKHYLIKNEWLHENLHITAMGSDSEEKNELDPKILKKADVLVVDKKSQSIERGEMRKAIEEKYIDENYPVIELQTICAKKVQARKNDKQITICDLTGTGIQDTAIASFALNAAQSLKLGTTINNVKT